MIEEERLLLNPFPGLRPFRLEENEVFFGRDGQSDEVLTKLRTARFVAVVGASGSGKSSLVSAGLLPALFSGHMPSAGSSWRVATFRPGSNPIRNLAEALSAPDVCGSPDQTNRPELLETIERTFRRSSLGLLEVVEQSRLAPGENLLILADQFEELFRFRKKSTSEHPEDEAAAFVKLLLGCKQSGKRDEEKLPIYVILTMRSDYLGDCAHFWGLPEAINEGQFLIPRMTDDNRREAITGPVIIGGGEITAPLVNRLLNDAGDDPAQLPILQHALARTWDYWKERCNAEGPIDIDHYEAVGGMSEALSNHANEAFGEIAVLPELRPLTSRLFKALTEKEADNREGRRPATIGEIAAAAEASEEQVKKIVEAFRREDRSFLMPPPPTALNSDTLIDISHESLIRGWVMLRKWVDEEADAARQYVRLAEKAALFPVDEPFLRDPALSNGLKWREENKPTRAWAVRYHPGYDKTIEYLELSKANRQAEIDEKERNHKEEVERELRHAEAIAVGERKRVKLRNWGLVVLSLLLLGMFAITVYAVKQNNLAQNQTIEAKKQKTIADAQKLEADTQRDRAETALKAVAKERDNAKRSQTDAETQRAVAVGALATAEEQRTKAEEQRKRADEQRKKAVEQATIAEAATKTANEQKVATAEALGTAEQLLATVSEIDLSAAYAKAAMRGHKSELKDVAFSPDGRTIVTASKDTSAWRWDTETGKFLMSYGHDGPITSATFSHDGNLIATASNDSSIGIWDAKTDYNLKKFGSSGRAYSSVVFSPDDKWVALIGQLQVGASRRETPGERTFPPLSPINKDSSDLNAVELRSVSVSEDKLITLSGHTGTINSLAFSRDGKRLVTASSDGTARVWDTSTGQSVAELRGHVGAVNSAEFNPEGTLVVTAGEDATAHVWDAKTGELLVKRTPGAETERAIETSTLHHDGPVRRARFSQKGDYIVTTSGNNAYLWAPESPNQWAATSDQSPTILKGHEDVVTDAVFSRNGKWVVTISQDRTARVWLAQTLDYVMPNRQGENEEEPAAAESLAVFRGHIKPVTVVQISDNSEYVVTGSEDKTARVWNLKNIGVMTVETTQLRADPAEYTGKCPVTIKFTGTISVGGRGGTVKYKFLRSDKANSLPQELVFDGPGSKELSTTWQLSPHRVSRSGAPLPFEGWQQIQILEPVLMISNQAGFSLTCKDSASQVPLSVLTEAQLQEIMPRIPPEKLKLYLSYLQTAMDEFGINTARRQAEFLAEVAHETGELRYMEEIASGAAYEGRKDLGNTETGDGKRFKGRGGFGTVGRANYQKFGEQLGIDLITQPELAATPEVAFRLAALEWQSKGLNGLADTSNTRSIRGRLYGGYNGLDDVIMFATRARKVLGVVTNP